MLGDFNVCPEEGKRESEREKEGERERGTCYENTANMSWMFCVHNSAPTH